MTRRALVFRHMDGDTGGCFPALLQDRGFDVSFVEWHKNETPADLASTDLIVALGGAVQVWEEDEHPWLVKEKAIIRDWVETRAKPYIGLCLGHQLLGTALGGEAGYVAEKEIGLCSVSFEDGREEIVTQWHMAEVSRAPEAATITASSDKCANQMMTIGDHAYSSQFHHEWDLQTVRNWQALWQTEMDKATGQAGFYNGFVNTVQQAQPALSSHTWSLFNSFMTRQGW